TSIIQPKISSIIFVHSNNFGFGMIFLIAGNKGKSKQAKNQKKVLHSFKLSLE
ncbi:MAG: hypothetical protein ACI9YL_002029, partial [Luteibaculaceae bacterium]